MKGLWQDCVHDLDVALEMFPNVNPRLAYLLL